MRVETIKGCSYVLTCSGACVVMAVRNDGGIDMRLVNASEGGQYTFVAPTDEVEVSDDTALVTRSFSSAPVGLSAVWGAIEKISGFDPSGGLTVGGVLHANGGINLVGDLMVGSGEVDGEVLRGMEPVAAWYYGEEFVWDRANILKYFSVQSLSGGGTGRGLTALPADTPFPASLAGLTNGDSLFSYSTLTRLPDDWTFDGLVNGFQMFGNAQLEELPAGMVLGNLTNGRLMFLHLRTATSLPEGLSLAKLQNGRAMFSAVKLESLPEGLSLGALTDGYQMFNSARLDKVSAVRVLGTLSAMSDGATHEFTIGVAAVHSGDAELQAAVDAATAKGWTVQVKFN